MQHLVWSGACLEHNRNAFDFRPYKVADQIRLSYALGETYRHDLPGPRGMFVLMDSSFQVLDTISPEGRFGFNFHEFRVLDNGKKALFLSSNHKTYNIYEEVETNRPPTQDDIKAFYVSDGAVMMDLSTREVEFEWWPRRHGVRPIESFDNESPDPYNSANFWDYLYVLLHLSQ